MLKLQK